MILACVAWFALGCNESTRMVSLQQDPFQKELPRLKATEPGDAPATFRLAPGYEIELVAAEPLVVDPVDMDFDEDGRLWVVEMIDYPFGDKEGNPPQGRVKLLEDRDGDGKFDQARVVAERLRWPTSLCLWQGGAFVASPPDILFVREGKREVVFTGFGTQNVQGLVNGLRWGADNWIYGSAGTNGGRIRSVKRPDVPEISVQGRDFRFRPTGEIEPISGGGQFGHSTDDHGRRFVCSNSVQARHVVLEDRHLKLNPFFAVPAVTASIAADGDSGAVFRTSPAEPWRLVRTRLRLSGQATGPVEHGGAVTGYFTSATGIFWHRGRLYIGDVASNLVHRKSLTPSGSTFRAERIDQASEFFTSTDNWFRPANFATGPDDALYVCDMYRECIEHPYSIPDEIKKHLDLTSGKDRGRIWRVREERGRAWTRPSLKTADELVRALRRPEAWWRRTASRLICERQDKSVIAELEAIGALGALEGLGALKPEVVARALKDPVGGVREEATRHATPEMLYGMGDDPDLRVRIEIAWKMAGVKDPRAKETIEKLKVGADRWLLWAIGIASGEKSEAPKPQAQPKPVVPAAPAAADRKKLIEEYRPALAVKGDAPRGREVYRKNCMACHKSGGEGQDVGPDLATVKARTPEELLTHILDPNREVNPLFVSTRVLTTAGEVLDGIVAAETATSVTLKQQEGKTVTILRVRIERMVQGALSLMPEGVEKAVDRQGMADLIEFLRAP